MDTTIAGIGSTHATHLYYRCLSYKKGLFVEDLRGYEGPIYNAVNNQHYK